MTSSNKDKQLYNEPTLQSEKNLEHFKMMEDLFNSSGRVIEGQNRRISKICVEASIK